MGESGKLARLRGACVTAALTASALLWAIPAAAEIYKWVDAKGRVHFTDQPPDKRRATVVQVRINSYDGAAVVSKLDSALVAMRGRVVLYGTKTCGYCKLARRHLGQRGVNFVDLDIGDSPAARGEYEKLGGRGVPVILVGNGRMDGFNAAGLDGLLKQAGL